MGFLSNIFNPAKRTIIEVTRPQPTPIGTDPDGTLFKDFLVLDACTSQTHQFDSDISQHPVEDGADITDHIRPQVDQLSFEAIISDTPLSVNSQLRGLATLAGAKLGQLAGGTLGSLGGALAAGALGGIVNTDKNRVKSAFEFLIDLRDKRIPFTIVTGLRVYTDMVFTSLTFPRDPNTGGKLVFSAQCQKVRIVQSQIVTIKRTKKAVAHTAGPKAKTGRQTVAEPKQEETRGSSLLASGFKNLGIIN